MISFFILRLTFYIFHCIYHFSWEMGNGKIKWELGNGKWELRTAGCELLFFRCGSAAEPGASFRLRRPDPDDVGTAPA